VTADGIAVESLITDILIGRDSKEVDMN